MFQTISMRQLEMLLDGVRTFTLLDVRLPEEYAKGHLEGAVNLPLDELGKAPDMISKDYPVVVYCAYGGQSMIASRTLDRMGYEVLNTSGGLYYYRGVHLVSRDA